MVLVLLRIVGLCTAAAGRTYLLADFSLVVCPEGTDEVFLLGNLTFGNIYKH